MRITSLAVLVTAISMIAASGAIATGTCLYGVNLSGAEGGRLPGRPGTDYTYPSVKTLDHFAHAGMTVIRLPFRWERLQPHLFDSLDPAELDRLNETVALAKADRLKVILDPHNYGYFGKDRIGSPAVPIAAFADFWRRLAIYFRNDPDVVFGLMNEPYDIQVLDWLRAANAALVAIRETGAKNLVLVPGTSYTGVHSWNVDTAAGNNSAVMIGVRDPANNFAYDVHQYLDSNFSGQHAECDRATSAIAAIGTFTKWLRTNKERGFLGEIGASEKPECIGALGTIVKQLGAARDVWIGFAYWAGGDWWPDDYMFSIQPTKAGDRPQLKALTTLFDTPSEKRPQCDSMKQW